MGSDRCPASVTRRRNNRHRLHPGAPQLNRSALERITASPAAGQGRSPVYFSESNGVVVQARSRRSWGAGRRVCTHGVGRSREKWVLDTAYSHWLDIVWPRTQLIGALDYPPQVSLARLLRRTASRIVTGELACSGNTESLRQAGSSDSVIAWHFHSFSRKRQQIATWQTEPSAPPVVRLRSPRLTEE
jgi:hypothetical protein